MEGCIEEQGYESQPLEVTVSGGTTNDGLSISKARPFHISSVSVEADTVLCVNCGRWIQSDTLREKTGTQSYFLEVNVMDTLEKQRRGKKSYVIK